MNCAKEKRKSGKRPKKRRFYGNQHSKKLIVGDISEPLPISASRKKMPSMKPPLNYHGIKLFNHTSNTSEWTLRKSKSIENDKIMQQFDEDKTQSYRKFVKMTKYTSHLQSHRSEKNCKYCEKEFSTPANRKRHENIHERGTPITKKKFLFHFKRSPPQLQEKEHFARHLQNNGSEKRCKYREKEFSSTYNRKRHEKIRELRPKDGKGPCEKDATSKADNQSKNAKIFDKNERKVKRSSQYKLLKGKLCRNEDKAHSRYYANIHSNIADNYMNHGDGGLNQLNLKKSNFGDQTESFDYGSNTREFSLSEQNYSGIDSALYKAEKYILSSQEQYLYEIGLQRIEGSVENILNLSSENSNTDEETAPSLIQNGPLIVKEKESHAVRMIYVCDVCKETFISYIEFEDHFHNNHPNVEVSFVEMEGTSNYLPKVPRESRIPPDTQPNGMLVFSEPPLPTQEQFNILCTKCETKFNTKSELYVHIFECATETREILSRRKLNQKNRKALALKSRNYSAKYYFNIEDNKRDRRSLPTKLCPSPCPFCI